MLQRAVPNRVIRYEVAALRDGRWMIECAHIDEAHGVAFAKRLLTVDGTEAVRVTRARETPGQIVLETPIYEERRPPQGKPILRVSETDDNDCWCDTLEDFYGGRSRRAIGQLLRAFLDQIGITQTELLHNYRHGKKLDATGNLGVAAMHRIAQARSNATGVALAECSRALEGLVSAAMTRARDAQASRGLPQLGEDGLDGLIEACNRLAQEPLEQAFLLRNVVSRTLEARYGLADKLQTVLAWRAGATTAPAQALIDELAADCLGSAPLIQDMLGRQPDLAAALTMLIDLARDQYKGTPVQAPAWFADFRALLAEQACPETRTVLLARVQRELGVEKALTRGGPNDEVKALTAIGERLKNDAEGSFLGGTGTVKALARRWSKLDVPGGFGDVALPAGKPAEQLRALFAFERRAFGEARKRAVATLAVDIVKDIPHLERDGLADLWPTIQASGLPAPARQRILRELGGA